MGNNSQIYRMTILIQYWEKENNVWNIKLFTDLSIFLGSYETSIHYYSTNTCHSLPRLNEWARGCFYDLLFVYKARSFKLFQEKFSFKEYFKITFPKFKNVNAFSTFYGVMNFLLKNPNPNQLEETNFNKTFFSSHFGYLLCCLFT